MKKEKYMSQLLKANLYMIMGALLVAVTFIWSISIFVPKMAFIVIGIIGLIPIIITNQFAGECVSEEETFLWQKAQSETANMIAWLLIIFWLFNCISKIVTLPVTADVCYAVPYLIGTGYFFTGSRFKVLKNFLDDEFD